MSVPTPDARLLSVAEYVRQGACFADIGTDHARLPVFLISSGRIVRAYATDVAEGPLAHARETVAAAGMGDRVTLLLRDGLSGMESLSLSDIAVCGMGGELIIRILAAADFIRDPGVRLILQPMTRAACLRRWLAANGFAIRSETFSLAARRAYVTLCVSYTGTPLPLSETDTEVGTPPSWQNPGSPAFHAYLSARIRALTKVAEGQKMRGDMRGAEETRKTISHIRAYLTQKEVSHDGIGSLPPLL